MCYEYVLRNRRDGSCRDGSTGLLVHHFVQDWNISMTIRWIVMKRHVMNPYNFCDPLISSSVDMYCLEFDILTTLEQIAVEFATDI